MCESAMDMPRLELLATIGFNGKISSGLKVHPDKQHLVYSVGNTVVIEDISTHQQDFLQGHTNDVACLAISTSGKYIASGQVTYMGFKADIIVWNYETRDIHCKLSLHKVKVEALSFSPNDLYLASLGGQDDGSVVIWNIANKEAICGSPAQVTSAGITFCVAFAKTSDYDFITAGDNTLRVWSLDLPNRKIRPIDVNMGQLKRIVKCVEVGDDDEFLYCGTTTGDILGINIRTRLFQYLGPEKNKFSQGVESIALLKSGEILVGAGDGTVQKICKCKKNKKDTTFKRDGLSQTLHGGVTSIALRGQGHQFYAGTKKCDIYRFNLTEFKHDLMTTCHSSPINDVAFLCGGPSDLFVTCSKEDIRVWETTANKERLRINVPNMTCNGITIMADGKSIISGWDDGKIRAFGPETGKLLYKIEDAHNKGVTAIATTSDCKKIISGGGEGQVRVWEAKKDSAKLLQAMKEHTAQVNWIILKKCFRECDQECVSASADGTCIIWNLNKFVRNQIIFANTLFHCVCYDTEQIQIITSGTDRKIGYWDTLDGSQVRELEGSQSGAIHGMDITPCKHFVTGGDDKLVKVWTYDEGEVTHVGIGHCGNITKVKVCPHQRYIVSVSADGAILRWKFPFFHDQGVM